MKSLLILGFTLFSLGNVVPTKALSESKNAMPLAKAAIAQNNIESNIKTVLAQTTPATQTPVSPLIQAGKALLSLERYELESVMKITGDIPGTSFVSDAKIKTAVAAPNKFNSKIAFVSPNGLEGKAYDIISDGSQVWIYDYASNQYSISEYKPFLQTREGFLVGALSYFYLNTRSNIGSSNIIANFLAKLPEDRLLKYFQRFSNLDLQNSVIRDETIEGTAYKAYDIDATSRGFQATAYINPEQGNLERVHLSGTKDGLQLASQEQVINQTVPESFAEDTFTFTPPENAQQVEQQIAIAPF